MATTMRTDLTYRSPREPGVRESGITDFLRRKLVEAWPDSLRVSDAADAMVAAGFYPWADHHQREICRQ